jgi:hypothetical protein
MRNRQKWPTTSIFWHQSHGAWAIEGSEGIILVEALFDLRRERRDSGRHEKARSG